MLRHVSKEQCQKLWTSYGFATFLLLYLAPLQQITLQQLNKFWYNIAISRVLISTAVD